MIQQNHQHVARELLAVADSIRQARNQLHRLLRDPITGPLLDKHTNTIAVISNEGFAAAEAMETLAGVLGTPPAA